jgi:3-oxoacyl-[acyl-carrier protein] reductase
MKLLEGKTALITGAARGIGRAIALKMAENGANIAFTDLHYDEQMKNTEAELNKFDVQVRAYASNAASFSDTEESVQKMLEDFEGLHIIVNNAGITRDNLLMRMTEDQWDMVINVNLKSAFNVTKAVQKTLLKQRMGSIINVGSVVGIEGNAGQANYAASKAGLFGFTKSVAQELGSRNIRCNAIAPGFIETEMTQQLSDEVRQGWMNDIPLKRGGTPEDVANVCVFLASDMSAYITGQVISICGGMHT